MKPISVVFTSLKPARTLCGLAVAIAFATMAPCALADDDSFWSPLQDAMDSVTGLFSSDEATDTTAKTANEADLLPLGPIDQPNIVGDLAYGDMLFDYYQERYFSAITKILVAQERGLLKRDSEHARIVLGALYVSYGLLDEGEKLFQELLTQNTSPDGGDEAWYQLARIYYKRGATQHALDILTHNVVAPLETRATEHTLLQVLCHIRLGQTDQAKALLPNLKDQKALSVFVRFNMGSAFAQLGDLDQATRYFSDVSARPAQSEDDHVLKDQASLALGVHYLQQEKWQEARTTLERIRLYGPVANRGLLALGWTHFNTGDQPGALTPWLELTERDLTDPAVQEALLNVPYVFEQQGALQEALNRYRDAYKIFQNQRNALENIKSEILQPAWIESISPVATADTQNVMGGVPDFVLPVDNKSARFLYRYFASNEFQRTYHDYRELQRLYMVLVHWQRQLPSFNQMIATNVERLDTLGPASEKAVDRSRKFYAYARVKLDDFNIRLNEIVANDDLAGTANVQQLTQKERLDSAESVLTEMGDPAEHEEEWNKLKLLRGLLQWDLSATAVDRRWEMTKDRIAIENLLTDLESSIRRVQAARDFRLDRFYGFETRVIELDQRMKSMQADIAKALRNNRHYMQAVALSIVEEHQVQLDRMRAKSLLSIARLQDRGYMQERNRADTARRQSITVELGKDPGMANPDADDIPVGKKPAARSLGDVIDRIFSE